MSGVKTADQDWAPRPGTNPLGWTVWHLTRVQDGQIADLMGEPDLWTRDGWHQKFNRPADHEDSGYGHTPEQVRAFRSPSAKVQGDYLRATTERTKQYLARLTPAELDRELDESWYTPRPTVGVRLLSILADCHQHAGEASYIRGLLTARDRSARAAADPPFPARQPQARPQEAPRPSRQPRGAPGRAFSPDSRPRE